MGETFILHKRNKSSHFSEKQNSHKEFLEIKKKRSKEKWGKGSEQVIQRKNTSG